MAQLNERAAQPKLSVRIGIDSGRVVVGAGAGKAVDAFGDTANIAARVEVAADADTVMISEVRIDLSPGCSWSRIAGRTNSKVSNSPSNSTG